MINLENWRYNRALKGCSQLSEQRQSELDLFLTDEYLTQRALSQMKAGTETPIANLPGIDVWHKKPELMDNKVQIVTVDGMPGTGKTKTLKRYENSLTNKKKYNYLFAPDGSDYFKANPDVQDMVKLKHTRPVAYHTAYPKKRVSLK